MRGGTRTSPKKIRRWRLSWCACLGLSRRTRWTRWGVEGLGEHTLMSVYTSTRLQVSEMVALKWRRPKVVGGDL